MVKSLIWPVKEKKIDEQALEEMYRLKTGALLEAACVSGCLLAGREDEVSSAENYARFLGLAFQIVDDILDVTGDQSLLGKPVGSDAANQKIRLSPCWGWKNHEKLRKVIQKKRCAN